MAEVPVVLRVFAEKAPSVNSVLHETEQQFNRLAGSVESFGLSMAKIGAISAAAMGSVLASVVNTAGQFEQLEVKLQSALGSADKAQRVFASAVEYAAKTPFDVQGIVQGTVLLETFGQQSEKVLPLAANLAAAFGGRVQDASLELGKALSGSVTGFRSLRDLYGITTLSLERYGASVNKMGGISVKTTGDLEKARNALEKLISLKFGDAVERQSHTLFGVLSNLGDAVTRLSASFGQVLLPGLTQVALGLTTVVSAFEKMPEPLKAAAAYSLVLGTAMGGLVVIGGGLLSFLVSTAGRLTAFGIAMNGLATAGRVAGPVVATLSGLVDQFGVPLASVAAKAPVAAAAVGSVAAQSQLAATGVATLTSTVTALIGRLAAFVATPFGAVIAAATVVLVGGKLALAEYEAEMNKLGEAAGKNSRLVVDAAEGFRQAAEKIRLATGSNVEFTHSGSDVRETAQKVKQALANVAPADLVNKLKSMGVSLDDLRKTITDTGHGAEEARGQITTLADARDQLEKAKGGGHEEARIQKELASNKALIALLAGQPVTIENIDKAVANLTTTMAQYRSANQIWTSLKDAIESVDKAFDEVSQKAEKFQTYLRVATKTDNIKALHDTMGELNLKIVEITRDLEKQGVPVGNMVALQHVLLTGTVEQRKAAQSLLTLYESQEELAKHTAAAEKKKIDDHIHQVESTLERETLLKGQNLARDRAAYVELLKTVKAGSEEEISLLRHVHEIDTKLKADRVKTARESFTNQVQIAKAGVDELKGSGTATATQIADALTGVVGKMEAWYKAHKKLVDATPEFKAQYTAALQGVKKEIEKTKGIEVPKERLDRVLAESRQFGVEATTAVDRLAASEQRLDLLQIAAKSSQFKGLNEQKRIHEEIRQQVHTHAQLQRESDKESLERVKDSKDIRRTGLEQSLELLKKQQELTGQKNTYKIKEIEQTVLASKLDAIRDQEKSEILSGYTKVEAAKRAEERITQFKRAEVLRRIEEQQKETDSANAEGNKILALRQKLSGLKDNRVGGGASPLQSVEEIATESQLGDILSQFPDAKKFGQVPPNIRQIQSKVENDLRQGERGRKKVDGPDPQRSHYETNTVIFNGAKLDWDMDAASKHILRGIVNKAAARTNKRMLNGVAAPEGLALPDPLGLGGDVLATP